MLKGYCKKCGYCCTGIQIVMIGNNLKEWIKARGFEIIQENGAYIEVRIEIPCPHYKNKCDIQNNKPEICKKFPEGMPEYLISKGLDPNKSLGPTCGFYYEDI